MSAIRHNTNRAEERKKKALPYGRSTVSLPLAPPICYQLNKSVL